MYSDDDVDMMTGMLKLIQQLCEGHNQTLQDFLGEDYTALQLDIFSAPIAADDDDDDPKGEEEEEDASGEPNNIVQWTSQMIKMLLGSMLKAQDWQASMAGREKQYFFLQQLFETASELVQGPNMTNQRLLLNFGICADVNKLWLIVRKDEFEFRDLIQDNEDLFRSWMLLLCAMRKVEISALRLLLSLLEETPLEQDDPDYAELQTALVFHKTLTFKRMVQELRPRALTDKIITHWNLSPEVNDPQFEVKLLDDDDDEQGENVVRPKREELEAEEIYPLTSQKDHCLEICALCYSVFNAVVTAPELKSAQFKEMEIERGPPPDGEQAPEVYNTSIWLSAKAKVYDVFNAKVANMHNSKYLHFLFGQVEIVRGARLQRIYFLVPRQIRVLKNHALIKEWQEELLMIVDRTSPEAQIDSFADMVKDQYISFVRHQFSLHERPWPFNKASEVISFCINATMLTTIVINTFLTCVYVGSYSKSLWVAKPEQHFKHHFYVQILTAFAFTHFVLSLIWIFFYILTKSGWKVETNINDWRDQNPRKANMLNNPIFKVYMQVSYFFSDPGLVWTLFLLAFSFLGFHVNFLFNAVNTIDLCMRVPTLLKVIQSITQSRTQVIMTMMLGFCMQYIAVGFSFLLFGTGYHFADMDTSGCATLLDCLYAHFDYGFRSAPVWGSAKITAVRFVFDYLYNLIIILIMAAIISGIIIDNFSELKEEQKNIYQAMSSTCFICSLGKSELQRKGVNFESHIYQDHYMWAYARFLLYLNETPRTNLTGPESNVAKLMKVNSTSFFPLYKCIKTESSEGGEAHKEREVQVQDMDVFKTAFRGVADNTDKIMKAEQSFRSELRDLTESVVQAASKIMELQQSLAQDEDTKKKKKKGA
uniref:Ion transport domain-containing protein n=1 Tax=Alexandrium monilatum TaxID=311494 RepID=A0A7S4SW96_9DINO